MISNNHVYINMLFCCIFCDIENKTELKKHNGCGRLVQTHSINNSKVSGLTRIFYDYVTDNNKKIE